MPTKRTMTRWALARRLQMLAIRVAAGKPIRIGRTSIRVPDKVVWEEELETEDGQTELEIELKWPVAATAARRRKVARTSRRRAPKRVS